MKPSELRVGAAQTEISPPLEAGLLMSSVERRWAPFRGTKAPLCARALVVENGHHRRALVSLDLLGLTSVAVGGWMRFKRTIAQAAGHEWSADDFVITCTHTHSAPDSLGLTTLHREPAFREWVRGLPRQIGTILRSASANREPCRLELASTTLPGFWIQRRIATPTGIKLSDRFQPIPDSWLARKPVDRRVRTLQFRGASGAIRATVVHASCHPVNEMCLPYISPDYPGALCDELSKHGDQGLVLFLNGASADLNPLTVSEGRAASIRQGRALAEAVRNSLPRAKPIPTPFAGWGKLQQPIPTRTLLGMKARRVCQARLHAFALGSVAIVFLPGEIFVETGRAIERASPFAHTLVVSYAEHSVGYLTPARVLTEGGYEAGPGRWSYLAPAAEQIVTRAAKQLLGRVRKHRTQTQAR